MTKRSGKKAAPRQSWMIVRVLLAAQGGEEFVGAPGRDLLVSDTHTFADLATAIDRAFARWDLSHLHEFRFADGRRIGMIDLDDLDGDESSATRTATRSSCFWPDTTRGTRQTGSARTGRSSWRGSVSPSSAAAEG